MVADALLEAGFADPVLESQSTFRTLMDAMAHPGRIFACHGLDHAPLPLAPVTAAVVLTLTDPDTPVWLDPPLAKSDAVRAWLAFHSGASLVEARESASFALIADPLAMPALDSFALGSEAYPDRSATLILQVERFDDLGRLLSGPGLATPQRFGAAPLPAGFWDQLRSNRALFPRGVDLVLAGPASLAALPRSLRIGEA